MATEDDSSLIRHRLSAIEQQIESVKILFSRRDEKLQEMLEARDKQLREERAKDVEAVYRKFKDTLDLDLDSEESKSKWRSAVEWANSRAATANAESRKTLSEKARGRIIGGAALLTAVILLGDKLAVALHMVTNLMTMAGAGK